MKVIVNIFDPLCGASSVEDFFFGDYNITADAVRKEEWEVGVDVTPEICSKWMDRETHELYFLMVYREGKRECYFATKELFATVNEISSQALGISSQALLLQLREGRIWTKVYGRMCDEMYGQMMDYVHEVCRVLIDSEIIDSGHGLLEKTSLFFVALFYEWMKDKNYSEQVCFIAVQKYISELSMSSKGFSENEMWQLYAAILKDVARIKKAVDCATIDDMSKKNISDIPFIIYCGLISPLLTELYFKYVCDEIRKDIAKSVAWDVADVFSSFFHDFYYQ